MMNQLAQGLIPAGTAAQREIPRMLEDLTALINEIEERLGDLNCAISPVLSPSVPSDKAQKVPTPPLGSPLAMTLEQANNKLYQIQFAIRDLTSRVQL